MNTFKTVQCATSIFIIILLTERCHSRNVEDNVQFISSETKYVTFIKKLRKPDLIVQQNNNINIIRDPEIPLDILEEKDETNKQESLSYIYLKTKGENISRLKNKRRFSRQINNGYSSIYPSLPPFNPNAYNMYSTPYKTPGPQYNGSSLPPTNTYNYPSNVNSFNNIANHNQYPQNSAFQASVPPFNYNSRPPYYPHGQNLLPNNAQNSWYNQSSVQNSNPYNYYNKSNNYFKNSQNSRFLYSNTTNFNPGSNQPNYNQFYGLVGKPNNTNIYNTPNVYNFNNGTRNNPASEFFKSAPSMNGTFPSQPFRSSNFSTYNIPSNKGIISNVPIPNYPTYRPSTVNGNFRSTNLGISNYSQNAAFNPYNTPKTQISNQNYPVNPTHYNSSYSNYRNQQIYSQNNYYNKPQNNTYFTSNKNPFNNSIGGTTIGGQYQNKLIYNATNFPTNVNYYPHLNQSSYTQTTPMPTPYFNSNIRPQNNLSGPNQSNWTEPHHFFYTPGGNNLNGTANYNLPHKYYK